MRQALFLIACASALGIAAVGCGGGGNVTPKPVTSATASPTPTPTPTPTPIPLPSQTPYVVQAVATLPPATPVPAGQTPAPVPVALPTGGPVSGSMDIATSGSAISPGTQIATQLTNTAPAGLPGLTTLVRTHYSSGSAQGGAAISVIAYLNVLFNEDVLLSQAPSFKFSLSSSYVFPGASYYLAMYNPNLPALGWQLGFEGPGTVTGSTVTFTGGSSSIYFQAWTSYYLGLYAVPASAATPTPAPSATPTMAPTVAPSALPTGMPTPTPTPSPAPNPTPTPGFELVPSTLTFNGTGLTQTFSAIDFGYSGAYTATSSDSKIATVSVSGSTFTVTSAGAGTATITVSESNGKTATCTVIVTTTTIPIN